MGLDMYLKAGKYVSGYEFSKGPEKDAFAQLVEQNGLTDYVSKESPHAMIYVCVGYWRKANAIHKWFVDNCQGGVDECQLSYVDTDKLKQLRDDCEKVIADPEKAAELLPSQSGFFFGSTEYDEYYIDDLKRTVEIIDKCLKLEHGEFYYQASW